MGGLEKHLEALQATLSPILCLPSAPTNNFQECFSWLCVFQIREKVKYLLYKNVFFNPA